MTDTTIYLHSQTKRLQTKSHLFIAGLLIFKAINLPPGSEYYYLYIFLNAFFTFLLVSNFVFQVIKKYKYREVATILNMVTGIFLIIESLSKLEIAISEFYLVTLALGIFITLMGALDERIQRIPHISLDNNQVTGRVGLLQPFSYSWHEIADIDFKPARVKIILRNGKVIRHRVARQSANGLFIRTVEDNYYQIREARKELQLV